MWLVYAHVLCNNEGVSIAGVGRLRLPIDDYPLKVPNTFARGLKNAFVVSRLHAELDL